nr:hypothetical protein [Tanacetum cinerariifolium]
MDMKINQQVALDEALVPHASRLRIGKRNFHLRSDIMSKELTLQLVYDVLRLTPFYKAFLVTADPFDELLFEEEILAFLRNLGHIINKCLSGKSTGYDSLRLSQAQIIWGMYHRKNVDFAYILWEDFVYQVEHKDAKKSNEMYYPRFIKVTINFFMTKDPSIPKRNKFGAILHVELTNEDIRNFAAYKEYYAIASGAAPPKTKESDPLIPKRNKVNWHYVRDDQMFMTIKLVSRHQNTQQFGAMLLVEVTNEDIRDSTAYKEYYAIASGAAPPKTKARVVPTLQCHLQRLQLSIHEEEAKDEESFDPIVQTSKNFDDEGNNDANLGMNVGGEAGQDAEDDNEELYRDVNINLEGRASSSVSSQFVTSMLNPSPDVGTNSLFESTRRVDVQASTTVAPLILTAPTLPPPTIPNISQVPQTPTPPTTAPSTFLQDLLNFGSLFGFDHHLKTLKANFSEFVQTNQFAGAVSSIPRIVERYMDQRMNEAVKNIQKIIKEQVKEHVKVQVSKILLKIKKTVNEQLEAKVLTRSSNSSKTSYAVAADLTEMELKKILIEKMESNKSIHQSDEQRNLYKALVDAYECDKIILDIYGDTVTLKRRRDDANKDKEPSTGSDWGSKRRRKGKETYESALAEELMQTTQDLEEPSHQEFETVDADDQPIVEASQHPECDLAKQAGSRSLFNELMDTPVDFSAFLINQLKVDTLTLELLAGLTYELMKGSCKSLVELKFFLEEVYKATADQLDWNNPKGQQYPHNMLKPLPLIHNTLGHRVIPFDHFINNDLEYLRGGASSHKYTTSVTKTKAADYGHIKDDDKLYKFKEGDFKMLRIQDIKDMLLLLVQRKLINLTIEEPFAFNVSLRMSTRSIVIQRRMEDLQLGVKSYQKKLNLTKPDTYRSDLKRKEAYTAYSNLRGFIYQNKHKQNRLMRIDELHKFSDVMLNDVRTALDDHLKGIRMKYLPQAIWRKSGKERAAAMIQTIDKQLKTRRIMRSLEKKGDKDRAAAMIQAIDKMLKTRRIMRSLESDEVLKLKNFKKDASKSSQVIKSIKSLSNPLSLNLSYECVKDYKISQKESLNGRVAELESLVCIKDREIKDIDAIVTSLKSQNDRLVDQVCALDISSSGLQEKVSIYENCIEDGSSSVREVLPSSPYYYLLSKMASYPRHGACGYRGWVVRGITHGKEGGSLVDVAAHNPSAETDYIAALQRLQSVNFSLLAQLRANKDASIETLFDLLRLEESFAKRLVLHEVQKIRENIANRRSALHDVFGPLAKPFSFAALVGMEGTSNVVCAAVHTTTALSTTFASASTVPPTTIEDYEFIGTGGPKGAQGSVEVASFPQSVEFEKEELDTTPERSLSLISNGRTVNVEETPPKTMVAINGVGFD